MVKQEPSIGRIVHYAEEVALGKGQTTINVYAAIITAVHGDQGVDLTVFMPNTTGFVQGCPSSDQVGVYQNMRWTWPPVVRPAPAPSTIVEG